jgi:dynein heavy chain, axonemal
MCVLLGADADNQVISTCTVRYRRTAHVTPKSYLSFLSGYKTIYNQKNDEIGEMFNRMTTGLEKLVEASQSVTELSKELALKEKELAVATLKAEEVLKQVPSLFLALKCML